MGRDRGAGDREKRRREVYGRREKRGREAGFPRKREKKGKITQHCAIFRNRILNAKGREPKNTGREPGLKGTGSGRFKPPCPPPLGSESAVSQAPTEQSINLCKRLLQTLSGNSPCGKNVRGRFLHVGKSLPQVFEICRRIRTKMILKGISGKNLGKNNDSEKNAPSENQFVVFMRVTLR